MSDLRDEILVHPPNMVAEIRKNFGLESEERMNDAIQLLQDWIQKQDHFIKKDFSKHYLETALISSKGSIERAKQRLDRLCTLRTLIPNFFDTLNPRDLTGIEEIVGGMLPQPDKEYNRVYIYKYLGSRFDSYRYTNYFKHTIIMAEYLRHHAYFNGVILVFDNTEINMMDLLTGFNLVETRNILTCLMEGYGMRMKGMHILASKSSSNAVYELLIKVFKSVVSEKLANRLFMHRNVDEIFKYVPREILPSDYGGKEMSLADLKEKWNDVLGSEEHMKLMEEINKAKIDKTAKRGEKYYEEYFGLPGSFRKLEVD